MNISVIVQIFRPISKGNDHNLWKSLTQSQLSLNLTFENNSTNHHIARILNGP